MKIIKWRYIGHRIIILSPLSIEDRGCLLESSFENEWCYHSNYWPNEICSVFFPLRVPSLSKHKAERYANKYNYQAERTITNDLYLLQENLTAALSIFLHVIIYIFVNQYNQTYIECSLQYWKYKHYYYSLVLNISEFFLLFLLQHVILDVLFLHKHQVHIPINELILDNLLHLHDLKWYPNCKKEFRKLHKYGRHLIWINLVIKTFFSFFLTFVIV